MHNILMVLKYEIKSTLGKRSFWIMTFLFPVVVMVLSLATQVITNSSLTKSNELIPEAGKGAAPTIGYIDQAGLIRKIPAEIPQGLLKQYPDEASARLALESGALKEYVLLPADFMQTNKLVEVQREFQPMGNTQEDLFRYLVTYNLTGDSNLSAALISPQKSVSTHDLAPQATGNSASPLADVIPYATLMIFFFLLTTSSGLMLQSVTREKENYMVEVLLVSLNPRDLMLGKILGLAVVAILQFALWIGGGLLLMNRGQSLLGAISSYQLPPGFLVYAVLFFGFGYLVYASLMGMVGALSPSAREGGQFTFIFMLPLMLPLFFNFAFADAPNGPLPVILSLIPLCAPSAMMTRLAITNVPIWQLALSLGLLAVTAYILVMLSARFFKADNLLSSAVFRWDRFFGQMKG